MTSDSTRGGRRASLLLIPVAGVAFGTITGNPINASLFTAIFGLLWGVAAMAVAPRLARRGERSATWAKAPVFVAMPIAFMVLGAGLAVHALANSPEFMLTLLRRPGYGPLFYGIHFTFEWVLLPAALMLNWHHPVRRKLLIWTAVAFYAGRLGSALYFAPNALEWNANPAPTASLLAEVGLWMNLDWIRFLVQDLCTACLLLMLAFRTSLRPRPSPATEVRRPDGARRQRGAPGD